VIRIFIYNIFLFNYLSKLQIPKIECCSFLVLAVMLVCYGIDKNSNHIPSKEFELLVIFYKDLVMCVLSSNKGLSILYSFW
jgi:hypothetical protein